MIYSIKFGYTFNDRVDGATYKSWYTCHGFGKNGTCLLNVYSTSSLYPTINTPTRITATSKTVTNNIFYNDFTKKIQLET